MQIKLYKKMVRSSLCILLFSLLFSCIFEDKSDTKELSQQAIVVKKPDFSSIQDIKKKKVAFFEYLYPNIKQVNLEVLELRKKLEIISTKKTVLSEKDQSFVFNLCQDFLKKCEKNPVNEISKKILSHIDVVPPSLVLAQAANESAWGTSRFAIKGNNYFGQWCFKKGCGIVPLSRNTGKIHEVRKFNSPLESVRSYVKNINKGVVYSDMRKIRETTRAKGKDIFGSQLVFGLIKYSERREAYVKEIGQLIKSNQLADFDTRFWQEIKKTKV